MTVAECRGWHDDQDDPPQLEDAPLCDPCRRRVEQTLDPEHPIGLPGLYASLVPALDPGRRGSGEKVGGSRGAPIPIDPVVLDLAWTVANAVLCWADVVRTAANLVGPPAFRVPTVRRTLVIERVATYDDKGRLVGPYMHWRRTARSVWDRPPDGATGYAIQQACATLHAHLDTLLTLPTTPVMRRITRNELATLPDDALGYTMAGGGRVTLDLDGVQAAHELVDLRRRARGLLGQTRRKDRLPLPCPACDVQTLVWWHGTDQVDCENCGRTWAHGDYQRLAKRIGKRLRDRTAAMTELIEFIRERLREEQAEAANPWQVTIDKQRLVREIEAKRSILDRYVALSAADQQGPIQEAIRDLGAIWGDHPAYREEWAHTANRPSQ